MKEAISVPCSCGAFVPFCRPCPVCGDGIQGAFNALFGTASAALGRSTTYYFATLYSLKLDFFPRESAPTVKDVAFLARRMLLIYKDLARTQAPGWKLLGNTLLHLSHYPLWDQFNPER